MKTRIILLFTALSLAVNIAAQTTSGRCGSNLRWSYDSSTKTLTITGNGAIDDYGYNYDTHKHTMPWEPYRDDIEKIILPSGLTRIGKYAFYDCSKLNSITIPNGVTSIGMCAFSGCTSLVKASVPNSVTDMDSQAFWDVPNIIYHGNAYGAPRDARCQNGYVEGNIVYSNSSKQTLVACASNTQGAITIPSSVTAIGPKAFYVCKYVTSITIPNSVQSIGKDAFSCCFKLTTLFIPASVTTIGEDAFSYCTKMESITIANSNVTIRKSAFSKCRSLQYIYSNANIDLSLTEAPNTAKKLAYSGSGSSSNTSYASASPQPSEDTSGSNKCGPNLTWRLDEASGTLVISGYGPMYQYATKAGFESPWNDYSTRSKIRNIQLPEGLTVIGSYAFYFCSNVTSITLPQSLCVIGDHAFSSCKNLTSITIPYNVHTIGEYAFAYCENLTSVSLPQNGLISKIESGTFSTTAITSIELPNSVSVIGGYAFSKCQNLKSVTLPKYINEIAKAAFDACPKVKINEYKKSTTPSSDAYSGVCGEKLNWHLDNYGVLTITGSGAMFNYSSDNKAPWGAYAIRSKIQKVVLPEGLTNIGDYAFYFCSNLTSINFPKSCRSIGHCAFNSCNSLTQLVLTEGLEKLDYGAFWSCPKLTSVKLPNSLLYIENNAFYSCSGLTSVLIPNSVNSIGYGVFGSCTALQSVTLSNCVTLINDNAFNDCPNLKEIKYERGFNINILPASISRSICRMIDAQPRNNTPSSTPVQTPIASTTPSVGSTPPNLTIVDESVAFVDQSQNNVIDAAEKCAIRFKIRNMGKGAANGCVATVRMSKDYYGISVQNRKLTTIAPGATMDVEIPLISNIETKTGQVTFSVEVTEPNGFGTDPFELTVNTHAFEQPYIQIVDYAITGNTGGTLVKKQPFNLQLMLQNTKYGRAENVEVEIVLPDNVFMLDGLQKTVIKELDGGKAKSLDFQLVVNNNYNNTFIPIQVKLKEKYGQFAENKTVTFQLNQNLASTRLTVKAAEEELVKQEIQLATIGSAVDKNIPVTKEKKSNTFAVIIANENYEQVAKVPYAINDGSIFKQYCEKTLGIPATNIHFVPDATINNIRQQVNWLSQVCQAYNGQANIIFYYAGHGVPDEQSKTAFLLPKDGNGMDITTGYKLDDLYKTLGQLPAKSVTIFLDACFSGSKREDGMLTSARGIAIKVKNGQPVGKMVVFTAATGDETAYPNNTEGHGMFTYYLLKKLQETSGNVTYEELGNYIRQNVSRQSIVLNGKSQTPTVIPSADATDWQNWKLK